jgi:hypothetical protein
VVLRELLLRASGGEVPAVAKLLAAKILKVETEIGRLGLLLRANSPFDI